MYTKVSKLLAFSLIASLAIFAVACGSDEEESSSSPAPATGAAAVAAEPTPTPPTATANEAKIAEQTADLLKAPEANAKSGGTLKYAFVAKPPHYDMHQSGTTNNCTPQCPLFDLLVMNAPTDNDRGIINGGLAESWESNADGSEWSFALRQGVKFHDGSDFDSADALATFQRIIFPAENVNSRRQGLFTAVESVTAPDANTLNFNMSRGVSGGYFLQSLASGFNVIVSEATLKERNDDLKESPDYPGTGPFKYVNHVDGELWESEKFVDYWNPSLPYLDGVNVYHMSGSAGAQQRVAGLLTGQFDYARGIDPQSYYEWVQDAPEGITPVRFPQTTIIAMWYNTFTDGSIFKDAEVRKATNLLFDRDSFVKATKDTRPFFPGFGYSPYFSQYALPVDEGRTRPGMAPTGPEKDAEIAKSAEMLAAAGIAEETPVRVVHTNNGWQKVMGDITAAQVDASPYFKVSQEEVEYSIWIEKTEEGDFDISMGPLVYMFADPSAYARPWYHSEGKTNFSKIGNDKTDSLIEQIDAELDPAKRLALTQELDLHLDTYMPLSPLLWEDFVDGYQSCIKGYDFPGMQGLYNSERRGTWWFDK